MSGLRTKIIVGVLAVVLVIGWATGLFGCHANKAKNGNGQGFAIPSNAPTYTVTATEISPRIDVVGTVTSEKKINLSSRIPAYVKEVFVSAGDAVTNGQVLITLDDRELAEQMAMAEAHLKQAETEYRRTEKLMAANASTEQALTAAKATYDSAMAQVQQTVVLLSYTTISSPIDGKVTDRRIEAGDLANPGQLLVAVYDPKNLRLEAPVPLRLIERLKLGQTTEVELSRNQPLFKGRVAEVVGEVDPVTQTQLVKVHLEDTPSTVLPGTFGRIWVYDTPQMGYLVPTSAVYRLGQLEMVQVVANNYASRRLVKTGPVFKDQIEILSGLQAGDIVLVNPIKM